MEQLMLDVQRMSDAIKRFDGNTKKSVGRLEKPEEVQSRLQQLDSKWAEFVRAWKAWQTVSDSAKVEPAFVEEFFDDVEDRCAIARATLLGLQRKLEPVVQQQAAVAVHMPVAGVNQNLRLPPIEPPTFSGEWDEWVSFRDLFTALVIKNTSLSDTHRLHLLRVACIGAAADEISGIDLSEGNFQIAWDAITKRFENERLIVFRLIERMLNIPAMQRECAHELARLINGTNQCIRALGVLKRETENLDDFLVVLTVSKLDVATRTAWERELGAQKQMPAYEELDEFLSGVLGSLEALKYISPSSSSSKNQQKRNALAHFVATADPRKCPLCQGPHGLYVCPQFVDLAVADRRKFVEEKQLCFRCISTNKHRAQACKNQYACKVCKQMHHHTLLHLEEQPAVASGSGERRYNPFDSPSTASTNMCTAVSIRDMRETLLPTAVVQLTAADGRTIKMRALIDQGSQVSLVSRQAVQRLGIQWRRTDIVVSGVANAAAGKTFGYVQLKAASCNKKGREIDVCALVLSSITADLPPTTVGRSTHPMLAKLQLADDQYWKSGRIDLLLGAAVVADVLLQGVRKADGLVAQETSFGWMLSGTAMLRPQVSANVACTSMHLDGLLRQFWEQEEVQRKPVMSAEDERCEEVYQQTTTRRADGRYVLELPFRQGGRELGDSLKGAVRRLLQMERKGQQHQQMFEGYKAFMAKYLELGHMERIPANEVDKQPHCYLPHHAVFKPDSTTTKLRVVFDATAATTNGCGLNALLLTGPRLQETLTSILMRWRSNKIGFSADIEKMYRQMIITPEHQEYQRIVWRDNAEDSIEHYRLKTVTYGTACAPYMAVKTIQRLADDESQRYPRAAQVVRNDFYVDDCMSGAKSVEEAIEIKDQLLKLMTAGGLRLLKWSSNCKELLATLPEDHIECQAPLRIDEDDSIKALGVHWHPAADQFGYKVHQLQDEGAKTKREMLSEIAKLFDPLGLLAPVIITAKITMQQLWLTGLGWDEELPEDVRGRWRTFKQELPQLEEIRVSRWFGHVGRPHAMQLHGFSDASNAAYAACVYARVQQTDGSVTVTLLAAKTKVAPIKQQCVPRLELNGAVLLSRLLAECRQSLRCADVEVFAWTDSTVVLAWLQRHANVWQTFVANRVGEIHTTMNATQWQHVPGVDNPADVASRGILPSELKQHPLWWSGPRWLHEDRTNWPRQQKLEVDETLLEEKKVMVSNVVQKTEMFNLVTRCSSWRKLLRVTAYCRKMLPARRFSGMALSADEIEEARLIWLRLAQSHDFGDVTQMVGDGAALQRHRLHKLSPFVDTHGLLRVGGRLENAIAAYDELHPVILGSKNEVAQLLIRDAHDRVYHSGPQATIGHLHQRYWLLNERREVRAVIHRCVTCAKARPRLQEQQMGVLPSARVRPSRPFLHTAADYAGPIWSRTAKGRGQKAHKSWIAVFVCLSTKAVHLELVSDLSSTAFIAAFRRFTSRRGLCTDVYVDNGTNFVGADREMRQQWKTCVRDDTWRAILAESRTQFHFSPPGSPHFNGLAEATVRMAKSAMRKVIGASTLTFEEMATFLAQVEAALNSRPLCVVAGDGNDANVLTPGHFLTGQPLTATPEPSILDVTVSATNRWRAVQQMTQHFWRRWSREYLHQLQQRKKWQSVTRDIQIGDVVALHDEMLHCTRWKLGRVVATHPGSDGHVRVATIQTATGLLKRAVVKLSLLPVHAGSD